MNTNSKNPKEGQGSKKVGMHVVPPSILMQVALAMTEGETRYSGYNWRDTPVKASTYYDSTWRHIADWYEGQDTDVKSGLPHIIKAIAGLIVLADGIQQGKFIDDRPPKYVDTDWLEKLNAKHLEVVAKATEAKLQCTG